ncbi:hypothetical protein KM043_003685 [Ampulex compressa]|nr:hypothetical protein KM043_003685 [Ampulex compressa]
MASDFVERRMREGESRRTRGKIGAGNEGMLREGKRRTPAACEAKRVERDFSTKSKIPRFSFRTLTSALKEPGWDVAQQVPAPSSRTYLRLQRRSLDGDVPLNVTRIHEGLIKPVLFGPPRNSNSREPLLENSQAMVSPGQGLSLEGRKLGVKRRRVAGGDVNGPRVEAVSSYQASRTGYLWISLSILSPAVYPPGWPYLCLESSFPRCDPSGETRIEPFSLQRPSLLCSPGAAGPERRFVSSYSTELLLSDHQPGSRASFPGNPLTGDDRSGATWDYEELSPSFPEIISNQTIGREIGWYCGSRSRGAAKASPFVATAMRAPGCTAETGRNEPDNRSANFHRPPLFSAYAPVFRRPNEFHGGLALIFISAAGCCRNAEATRERGTAFRKNLSAAAEKFRGDFPPPRISLKCAQTAPPE